ncbi:hypothetical protein FACS1894219_08390 [Clostridia bacterium]|nr:hypothetical protein FACS1894219_08390 [Clostridia bacterium]
MLEITNPRIEKVKDEIIKTKEKLSHYQSKLREQERLVVDLENLKIVSMFRSNDERYNEEIFALLRERQNAQNDMVEVVETPIPQVKIKEDKLNDIFEN